MHRTCALRKPYIRRLNWYGFKKHDFRDRHDNQNQTDVCCQSVWDTSCQSTAVFWKRGQGAEAHLHLKIHVIHVKNSHNTICNGQCSVLQNNIYPSAMHWPAQVHWLRIWYDNVSEISANIFGFLLDIFHKWNYIWGQTNHSSSKHNRPVQIKNRWNKTRQSACHSKWSLALFLHSEHSIFVHLNLSAHETLMYHVICKI